MKKVLFLFVVLCSVLCFAQGKKISLIKKSKDPITLSSGKILNVGDDLTIGLGMNSDGSYRFVQMINNLGEPVKPADSRAAMMKEKIKFFKEDSGVKYVFTKYFVINIEAAFKSHEVE